MTATKPAAVPERLRPFLALGYDIEEWSGQEAVGTCIFCGKQGKMYVNSMTGQWKCMAGHCGLTGNEYTLMTMYYNAFLDLSEDAPWEALSEDRGLPVEVLQASGIAYNGEAWLLPIQSIDGSTVNLRFYKPGEKLKGLPTMAASMYGAEKLKVNVDSPVFVCEGEWDAIAMQWILDRDEYEGIAVGIPGASVFKTQWADWLTNRTLVVCYDKDIDGIKGAKRVATACAPRGCTISWVAWPESIPDHYDIRDLAKDGATFDLIQEMIKPWSDPDTAASATTLVPTTPQKALKDKSRPSLEEVIRTYRKWLYMTEDMVDMVRLCYAVVISQQIPGDPLWMHMAGPPGSGKTAILLSLRTLSRCHFASTITPHTLVSGFSLQGGADPSLLPQLGGKTFVLKDFTEVLQMPPITKADVYSVLRGAYDGEVTKPFGNGIVRQYRCYFNMLSGVTQDIFAESGASLGERFLIFHVIRGVGFTSDDAILAAISNVGEDEKMKAELESIASSFLEVEVTAADREAVSLPIEIARKVVALAQFVSMLRASVAKDQRSGIVMHRPQHEVGTRLAKQFSKLLQGLALCHYPKGITDDDYRLLARVAMDSCIGFNLDIVRALWESDRQTVQELSEKCTIPISTLNERLKDLGMLGVLCRERVDGSMGRGVGQPPIHWYLTDVVKKHWRGAGLDVADVFSMTAASAEAKRDANLAPGTRKMRVKRSSTMSKPIPERAL